MDKRNVNSHRLSHGTALMEQKCRLLAGRVAVVAATLLFIGSYIYGITEYGPLLGIGVGWLPCAILAWIAALVVNAAVSAIAPYLISAWQQLSVLFRLFKLGMDHK